VNPTTQRTVVLAGGSVRARQTLAAKLQHSLLGKSLVFDFFCPASPLDLADTPANGRPLLWRNPQDATSTVMHEDWRQQLHTLQRNYQSLHADNEAVVQQAVYALLDGQVEAMKRPDIQAQWKGLCECCADPTCEQQLFGRLLQG